MRKVKVKKQAAAQQRNRDNELKMKKYCSGQKYLTFEAKERRRKEDGRIMYIRYNAKHP